MNCPYDGYIEFPQRQTMWFSRFNSFLRILAHSAVNDYKADGVCPRAGERKVSPLQRFAL